LHFRELNRDGVSGTTLRGEKCELLRPARVWEVKWIGHWLCSGSKPSISWNISLLMLSVGLQLVSFKNQPRLLKVTEFEALVAKR